MSSRRSTTVSPSDGRGRRYFEAAAFTLFLALLLMLLVVPAAEAASMYVLRDDDTGGDCVSIGTWDGVSKTCTLTSDVVVAVAGDIAIEIADSGITLEGNSRSISGMGPSFPPPDPLPWDAEYGVFLNGVSNVKVQNLLISDIDEGILLDRSENNTITGILLLQVTRGIIPVESNGNLILGNNCDDALWTCADVVASEFNEVQGNTFSGVGEWGVRVFQSKNNTVTSNSISNRGTSWEGLGDGLRIYMSDGNIFNNNTVEGMGWGVLATSGVGNQVYNNYFLGNNKQAEDLSGNVFNLPAPTGGNLWDDFDEPAEGCYDSDKDGFCDAPYTFTGNQDDLPLVGRPDLGLYRNNVYWEDFTAYLAGVLSVDYQLAVAGAVDAKGANVVGSVNTGGVTDASALPIAVGDINAGGLAPVTMRYRVPAGVTAFWSTVYATAHNYAGVDYAYPAPYPGP